jgi:hypothetical protein
VRRLTGSYFAFACAWVIAVATLGTRDVTALSRAQPRGLSVILSGPVSATGVMSDRTARVSVVPAAAPYDTGEPSVSILARPIRPDAPQPTVVRFRMRAWMDGDGARVAVFAVTAPTEATPGKEERLATFSLARGETKIITSTDAYGAAPIMVEATP